MTTRYQGTWVVTCETKQEADDYDEMVKRHPAVKQETLVRTGDSFAFDYDVTVD